MATPSRVCVAVRVRPYIRSERDAEVAKHGEGVQDCIRCDVQHGNVLLRHPYLREERQFTGFEHVLVSCPQLLPHSAVADTQESVYEAIGRPLVRGVFDGVNHCLFVYGGAATGKTYTLLGPKAHGSPGIVPRALDDILRLVRGARYTVEACLYGIVGEKVVDVLAGTSSKDHNDKRAELRVREHPRGGPYVDGLVAVELTTQAIANSLVEHVRDKGASTHMVLEVMLHNGAGDEPADAPLGKELCARVWGKLQGAKAEPADIRARYLTAKNLQRGHTRLTFCDLAGLQSPSQLNHPERKESNAAHDGDDLSSCTSTSVTRSGSAQSMSAQRARRSSTKDLARQAAGVNRSFTTLSRVIFALAEGSGAKVPPHRESLLTWLLKAKLSGRNCMTTVIATVAPHLSLHDVSMPTMHFAERVRRIRVTVPHPPRQATGTHEQTLRAALDEVELACTRQASVSDLLSNLQKRRSDLQRFLEGGPPPAASGGPLGDVPSCTAALESISERITQLQREEACTTQRVDHSRQALRDCFLTSPLLSQGGAAQPLRDHSVVSRLDPALSAPVQATLLRSLGPFRMERMRNELQMLRTQSQDAQLADVQHVPLQPTGLAAKVRDEPRRAKRQNARHEGVKLLVSDIDKSLRLTLQGDEESPHGKGGVARRRSSSGVLLNSRRFNRHKRPEREVGDGEASRCEKPADAAAQPSHPLGSLPGADKIHHILANGDPAVPDVEAVQATPRSTDGTARMRVRHVVLHNEHPAAAAGVAALNNYIATLQEREQECAESKAGGHPTDDDGFSYRLHRYKSPSGVGAALATEGVMRLGRARSAPTAVEVACSEAGEGDEVLLAPGVYASASHEGFVVRQALTLRPLLDVVLGTTLPPPCVDTATLPKPQAEAPHLQPRPSDVVLLALPSQKTCLTLEGGGRAHGLHITSTRGACGVHVRGCGVLSGCTVVASLCSAAVLCTERGSPLVHRNRVTGRRVGVHIAGSSTALVLANTITGCGGCAVVVEGGAARPLVQGNTIAFGKGGGIAVGVRARGRYIGNRVSDNECAGVLVEGRSNPTCEGNCIERNGGGGLIVRGEGTRGYFSENSFCGNTERDLLVRDHALPRVSSNQLCGGTLFGVVLCHGGGGIFAGNTVAEYSAFGILVRNGGGGLIVNNRVTYGADADGGCMLTGETGCGVVVNNSFWGRNTGTALMVDCSTCRGSLLADSIIKWNSVNCDVGSLMTHSQLIDFVVGLRSESMLPLLRPAI